MTKFRKLIVPVLAAIATLGAAAAMGVSPAAAAPYTHKFHCIVKVVPPTGHHKFTRIITRCSGGNKAPYRFVEVIHSKPVLLGVATPDKPVDATNDTEAIPQGFTGHHVITIHEVPKNKPVDMATELARPVEAASDEILIPIDLDKNGAPMAGASAGAVRYDAVGTGTTLGTGSSVLSPSGQTSDYELAAVIGIGALGVVLLAGGGLLLYAGRRRRVESA